jgi:predicted TIM-barrel fold metal-dependent hydrolase
MMPRECVMCLRLLPLLVLAASLNAAAQAPRRIIDMHIHAYSKDPRFGSRFISPFSGEEMVASSSSATHMEETLAAMHRLNVVKAAVSGDREAVLRWHQRAPESVIIGYDVVDPAELDLGFLRQEHAAGRLHVIGEITSQYAGILPAHPRFEPLFRLAEQLDIPVGFHMHPGPPGAPYPPFNFAKMRAGNGDPLLLEEVLVRHPKLRLYVMHAGWPFLDQMKALMYVHPHVYVDLGAIAWSQPRPEFHRFLRGLVEAGYGKRIMFGSDQMVWPDRIQKSIDAIESAGFLTPEQKRDIYCRNAAQFLRLPPRTCD